MPGARCARSLVCKIKKHTSIVTTVTPESPGIPRAMVLTVSFVLSPVTMLGCHRRLRFTRQLDTSVGASGPHDFAVRIKRRSSLSASASTASRPALMTLRNAPLGDRTVSDILLIWGKREAEYFCKWGWTGFTDLPVGASPRWVISGILTADRCLPVYPCENGHPESRAACLKSLAEAARLIQSTSFIQRTILGQYSSRVRLPMNRPR